MCLISAEGIKKDSASNKGGRSVESLSMWVGWKEHRKVEGSIGSLTMIEVLIESLCI